MVTAGLGLNNRVGVGSREAALARIVDRWWRAKEVPRLNGPVYLVTQTVHLDGDQADIESWAFDPDGSVVRRRAYGHRSSPLASEYRILTTKDDLPQLLVARRRLEPTGHEYKTSSWRVRFEPHAILESARGTRRAYEYDPFLDRLEYRVVGGVLGDAVIRWEFCEGGGTELSVVYGESRGRRQVGSWDEQNIQVRGSHGREWWLEVIERDDHGNPVTARRRNVPRAGDMVDEHDCGVAVTWEISYARSSR